MSTVATIANKTAINGTEANKASLLESFKKAGFAPLSMGMQQGTYNLQVTAEEEYFGLRAYETAKGKGAIICIACSGTDQNGKSHVFGLPTEKVRTLAIMEVHLAQLKQGSAFTIEVNEKGYISSFKLDGEEAATSNEPVTAASIKAMDKAALIALASSNSITLVGDETKPQLVAKLTEELT